MLTLASSLIPMIPIYMVFVPKVPNYYRPKVLLCGTMLPKNYDTKVTRYQTCKIPKLHGPKVGRYQNYMEPKL